MITLCLGPLTAHSRHLAFAYRVAGHGVASDFPLEVLAPYAEAAASAAEAVADVELVLASGHEPVKASDAHLVYRGPGWLGNQWRTFACRTSAVGYWLEIEGVGAFSVSPDGAWVRLERTKPGAAPAVVVEAALGPGLILALALQGTWCLHASGVTFGGQAIAFAGESGNGKSTLAAHLGTDGGAAWRPLADDILPVAPGANGLEALPHFPQLKMPPGAQPAVGQPERMPLRAIYLLSTPEAGRTAAEIQALSSREATLALVRHTVAARLFDRELLARHMAFCATAATHVPVRRLVYPREVEVLPRVREALKADLELALSS